MSLDISLSKVMEVEIFSSNITHNLTNMAEVAGIYKAVWRPEEEGIKTARQLIPILETGIESMLADPDKYKKYDAPNGWGTYHQFIPWLKELLAACKANPDATIEVSR
jgi:hypothetical protein